MKRPWMPLCGLVLLSAGACKKPESPPPAPVPVVDAAVAPAVPQPATQPAIVVGMTQPFAYLKDQAAKSFNSGWAAMKAKKYDDAAAAFGDVANAVPDYLPARFQAARAFLLGANSVGTRKELEELLARNFVAYAGRSASKEFAVFRNSPEWPAYQQAEARIRQAYARGLNQDLVFVARSGAVEPPTWKPGARKGLAEAGLDLKQEAYHYDPDLGRYRPLTSTDGHVVAALRGADGKRLVFVVATALRNDDGKIVFAEPQLGFLDLTTLETAGPVKLAGGHEELTIGFGASGTPLVVTSGAINPEGDAPAAGTYEIDTARTGLIKATTDPEIRGERVQVRPDRLTHVGPPLPAEVALSEDRHSIRLGTAGVITSARLLSDSTLAFAPGQHFFVYAGQLDGCLAARDDKSKGAQNELFVYDVEKKAATRVDSGPSAFTSVWLDDHTLAYETGIGAKGGITLFDVGTGKKSALPLHHGAGLYGVPTAACPTAAAPASAAPTAPAPPPAPPAAAAPAAPAAAPVAPSAPAP